LLNKYDVNKYDIFILNETVSNSSGNIITNNLNPENIDDYIYDQIYVKSKKTTNINIKNNNKFIKKYIEKTSNNSQQNKLKNIWSEPLDKP
jgi:hypothetical protein